MTLYDVYNAKVDGWRLRQAPGLVFNQLKQAFIDKTRECV